MVGSAQDRCNGRRRDAAPTAGSLEAVAMSNVDEAPIWTPTPQVVEAARIHDFARWLADRGVPLGPEYHDLWRWSVTDLEDFWDAVRAYFDVRFSVPGETVLAGEQMPGAEWYPG